MTGFEIAALYIGVNILLLVYLALHVVLGRRQYKILHGAGGNEDMELRIRTHGNATEYVPAMCIGLIVAALIHLPGWFIHLTGSLFTLGRLLHAFGLGGSVLPARQAGMALTWLPMIAIAVGFIYFALF